MISSELHANGSITVSCQVTNTGKKDGAELVQMYLHDLAGSVTRPVKELKGFEKIFLKAGETKTVSFTIKPQMLAFYRADMTFGTEPGEFEVYVGGNSRDVKKTMFSLEQ